MSTVNNKVSSLTQQPNKAKPSFSKQMLNSHSTIGLVVAAILYLVCISGTIAVFYPEFERWEQPNIPEFRSLSPQAIDNAYQGYMQKINNPSNSIYVVLPTQELPRAHVSDGENEWWLDSQGHLLEEVSQPWTTMLKDLHVYLHLPKNIGLMIVSLLGIMMTHLIISGVLAHTRIIKDAFSFKRGGTGQRQSIDLHNRLSVWALPFHLMIAITGAFFGLVSILILIAASAFFDNDRDALIAEIYGKEPIINNAPALDVVNTMQTFKKIAPKATPIYTVVQNIGKDNQYIEVAATLPERLIYSEIYHFNADGSFIGEQGMSTGDIGQQAIYSVYRLHFGHFGGYLIKLSYFLLGLALTYICVSGINIWLNKRKGVDNINFLWSGFVLGTPLALSFSFIISLVTSLSPVATFWGVVALALGLSVYIKCEHKIKATLAIYNAVALIALIICYQFLADPKHYSNLQYSINIALMVFVVCFVIYKIKVNKKMLSLAHS